MNNIEYLWQKLHSLQNLRCFVPGLWEKKICWSLVKTLWIQILNVSLISMYFWSSYWIFLCFGVLICETGIKIVFTQVVELKWVNVCDVLKRVPGTFMQACWVAQSRPTLCDSMDCSLPGSSAHGIFQARILSGLPFPSLRGSSRPRDWTCVSCIGRQIPYHWATWEARQAHSRCLNVSYIITTTTSSSCVALGNLLLLSDVMIHLTFLFLYKNRVIATSLGCHEEWMRQRLWQAW